MNKKLPNKIDPKEIVHYYVDGGVRDGVAASVFIRKAFKQPPREEVRRALSRSISSTKSEIRAIKLAMEDALEGGIDPNKVVIHTDQKSLVYGWLKKDSQMSELHKELMDYGFNLSYIPSTHTLESNVDTSKIPKKVLNALAVHNLVTDTLNKGHNRYRYHLSKKRAKKHSRKKAC